MKNLATKINQFSNFHLIFLIFIYCFVINNNFFMKYKHIHFVGIGGISMSALAKLCFSKGVFVSGSDKTKSDITDELTHIGMEIHIGHRKSNVKNVDLLVYTCAVGEDNVELSYARQRGIEVLERADFLGKLSKDYNTVIAIAGSHGKTTVCSMVGKVFNVAGLNPTILVGGEGETGNLQIGENNEYLIVEACEYKEHFLKLKHDVSLILNIDYDHPDFYKNSSEYMKAFEHFAKTTSKQNVICEKHMMFLGDTSAITYGTGGDFVARHIKHFDNKIKFDVYKKQKYYDTYTINMIGLYNVLNALCVIAVCDFFGINKDVQKAALEQFVGIKRRYECMGKLNNNIVIADYAHHPSQIKNCIEATRQTYKKKIVVLFEPHTYTRTKALFNDFVNSLYLADYVYFLPTYSAREKAIKGAKSKDLYDALVRKQNNCKYIKNYEKCLEEVAKVRDSVILILGAGSIYQIAQQLKSEYLHNQSNCSKTLD